MPAPRPGALDPDHRDVADPLVGLAEVALAQRRPTDAASVAERALALRTNEKAPAVELARARFALGRALWDDSPSRPRALALARQASEAYLGAGPRQAGRWPKCRRGS